PPSLPGGGVQGSRAARFFVVVGFPGKTFFLCPPAFFFVFSTADLTEPPTRRRCRYNRPFIRVSGLRFPPRSARSPGAGLDRQDGEVYRAPDPRLGRDVAVTILAARFSSDLDRLSRFKALGR